MAKIDGQYKLLALEVLGGYRYTDKSRGVDCIQIPSAYLDINIEDEFPLLTTKKMYFKGIVAELLWFLRGDSNIKSLADSGVHIWDKDAYNWYLKNVCEDAEPKDLVTFIDYIKEGIEWDEECKEYYTFGDVGLNYSEQWRAFTTVENGSVRYQDQISTLLDNLKKNPINRRNVVTAWNPGEINKTALPPCHWSWEVIPILNGDRYSFVLKWNQRSVDTFLGLPFNIASYALLAKIIELLTGYRASAIIGNLSNIHFYENHIDAVNEQLSRSKIQYRGCNIEFSEKIINSAEDFKKGSITFDAFINNFLIEDVILKDYNSFGPIKAEMLAPII